MSKVTKKDLNERLLMVETLLGLHRTLPEQISNEQANNAIFRMQCALSSGKELAERNPTEVEQRIEALEEFATYADNMLTELNHALPDPEYDAKCEAEVAGVEASLDRHRERLGLNKPQLKQLDQSVFDGLDEKWRFAMVSSVGIPFVYDYKPTGMRAFLSDSSAQLMVNLEKVMRIDEYDYDTSNWQNSLIERDIARELLEVDLISELTGSDLCRAMLERGDRYVMCVVGTHKEVVVINGIDGEGFTSRGSYLNYHTPIPINNQGEPLTAAEAGL